MNSRSYYDDSYSKNVAEKGENSQKALNAFLEWSKDSSSHGYPNIFRSKRPFIKFMWGFFFISATCACSYLVLKSLFEYLEYNVNTQIRVINQIPMNFPTINICNQNPFVREKGQQFVRDFFSEFLNKSITDYQSFREHVYFDETNLYSKESQYEYLFENLLIAAKNLNKSNQENLGYSIEEKMLQCYFNYEMCNFSQDFVSYYHHYYGNCVAYNSMFNQNGERVDVKKGITFDFESGFHIQLFLGFSKNTSENLYSFQYSKGFVLISY